MELPPEDYEEGMCGRLLKSMYGTRDAAQNWENGYSDFLEGAAFQRGISTPCMLLSQTPGMLPPNSTTAQANAAQVRPPRIAAIGDQFGRPRRGR